jgi:hypothetical protein
MYFFFPVVVSGLQDFFFPFVERSIAGFSLLGCPVMIVKLSIFQEKDGARIPPLLHIGQRLVGSYRDKLP